MFKLVRIDHKDRGYQIVDGLGLDQQTCTEIDMGGMAKPGGSVHAASMSSSFERLRNRYNTHTFINSLYSVSRNILGFL